MEGGGLCAGWGAEVVLFGGGCFCGGLMPLGLRCGILGPHEKRCGRIVGCIDVDRDRTL